MHFGLICDIFHRIVSIRRPNHIADAFVPVKPQASSLSESAVTQTLRKNIFVSLTIHRLSVDRLVFQERSDCGAQVEL
jgi:hypothetical protein